MYLSNRRRFRGNCQTLMGSSTSLCCLHVDLAASLASLHACSTRVWVCGQGFKRGGTGEGQGRYPPLRRKWVFSPPTPEANPPSKILILFRYHTVYGDLWRLFCCHVVLPIFATHTPHPSSKIYNENPGGVQRLLEKELQEYIQSEMKYYEEQIYHFHQGYKGF